MKYLITGGCGFLGSNISSEILRRGHQLTIFDNLSREGSERNLAWLKTCGDFVFIDGDVRSDSSVDASLRTSDPDVICHLAGQVAMTTSILDPRLDFEVNLLGSINLLEGIRRNCPSALAIYSSTNKVYGGLERVRHEEGSTRYSLTDFPGGITEQTPLEFSSPYGCSKGGADQYFLDYARVYGLSTIVFRHSSMYGGRQYSTVDQGWVGWFCGQALMQKLGRETEFTVSGNGKQVRDVLHADDMVELYLRAPTLSSRLSGKAFNVGGGMANSLSILELLEILADELDVKLNWRHIPARESDQRVFVANISRIAELTGWAPKIDMRSGIRRTLEWVTSSFDQDGGR